MRGTKAKALRRKAREQGPGTDQRLYRVYDAKPKLGVREVDPNCRRGIYLRLKRETMNGS